MRRRRSSALPDSWAAFAAEHLRVWPQLAEQEHTRMGRAAGVLLSKRWEASAGFVLDDDMRLLVTLHAALLYAGSDDEPFPNVSAIVLHPTTVVLRGERPGPFPGAVTDAPLPTLGHTTARGPVFLAWDAVLRDLHSEATAENVVLHEFAHKLDVADGTFDGTPRLGNVAQWQQWVDVCTAELQQLRAGGALGVLRPYAAKNPSEFFAVTTEAFFEQPVALQAEKPELYRVFARYYRQDPAARAGVAPSADTAHRGASGA